MVNTKPGLSPGPLRWRINKRLCNKRKGGMDLDLSQFRMILNCIFFIEVSNKQQARKLQATGHKILVDSYFIIRYSRINGEVEHRKICSLEPYNKLGISTTKCSSMRAPRKYPGLPVDSNVLMVMERPGDRDPQPEEPTSNKQSTSEQTLKHSGPGYTSNGRASKTIPQ